MARNMNVLLMTRTRIGISIEALWLVGLALIPLVFRGRELVAIFSQPKAFVLHFVALGIVVLWTVELATGPDLQRGSVSERVEGWFGRSIARWAIATVFGFGFVMVLSTLLSPEPLVSIWGRDFEALGYELYSSISFLVIFLAIALRARSRAQIFRIAYAVASAGTLAAAYGVSQHFGWDPIGRGADLPRVISSLGNPVFFGSYLVMTTTVTLAVGVLLRDDGKRWGLWVAGIAAGIQIAALWFTGSRGPWLGAGTGVIVALVLILMSVGRGRTLQLAAVLGLALVIGVGTIALPSDAADSSRGVQSMKSIPGEIIDVVGYLFFGQKTAELPDGLGFDPTERPGTPTLPPSVLPDLAGIVSLDDRSLAFSGRADIWRGGVELLGSRERPYDESGLVKGFRHLLGFGPDMYFYSYPMSASPQASLHGVSNAHNYALHVWLETGIVGLLMVLTTIGLVVTAGMKMLRSDPEPWLAILTAAVLGAIAGRGVEQLVGISRFSDMMLMWALLGLLIAMAEINTGHKSAADRDTGRGRRGRNTVPVRRGLRPIPLAGAALVTITALIIFVGKDVQQLRAGWIAADGFAQKRAGQADEAFRSFERAGDLAPDVQRYRLETASLLSRTAAQESDTEIAIRLFEAAGDVLRKYERRDGLAWETQLQLASISAELAARGDSRLGTEVTKRYENVAALMPPYPAIQSLAAENLVRSGASQAGLDAANRAIRMENITSVVPRAWWARGVALVQLGRLDEARISFESAIERDQTGQWGAMGHRGLAAILELQGDEPGAAIESDLARVIEEK